MCVGETLHCGILAFESKRGERQDRSATLFMGREMSPSNENSVKPPNLVNNPCSH